ncbi:MAG: hypothetical protein ABL927_08625 [Bdellovibrionales bacterium]
MALENLKEQLKDQLSDVWSKIQNDPTYNTFRERYESLPQNTQKIIVSGVASIIVLLLLAIPLSYLNTADDFISIYNEKRQMIRSLLKASRLASESSINVQMVTTDFLRNRIQNEIAAMSLTPEQKADVIDLDNRSLGTALVDKSIKQSGVGVHLKKLNLRQVVDLGFTLQDLYPSVKMSGLEITASSQDPHYFDVLYKLIIFSSENLTASNSGSDESQPPFNTKFNKKTEAKDETESAPITPEEVTE